MKPLRAIELQEYPTEPFEAAIATPEPEYVLNISGIYQDRMTLEWAMQTCHRATALAGEERIRNTWHDTQSLSNPAILQTAADAALSADVIVVSLHASEELPREFYLWVESWLPRRRQRVSTLAALIGVADPLDSPTLRTVEYLQTVARMGRLDFIPETRQRPASASDASPIEPAPPAI